VQSTRSSRTSTTHKKKTPACAGVFLMLIVPCTTSGAVFANLRSRGA
jgi:hypothetical protein